MLAEWRDPVIRAKRLANALKQAKPGTAFRNVLSYYKSGAKRRGLEFQLTDDDFKLLTQSCCTYCGSGPKSIVKSATEIYIYTGLDRRDNEKGYTCENTIPCCTLCNWMKRNLSYESFLKHVIKIAIWNPNRVGENNASTVLSN